MNLATAAAVYFLIWWITLFAVLPFGVRAQHEDRVPGTDPGAPAVPMLGRKLIWTDTVVATVLFGAFYGVIAAGADQFRRAAVAGHAALSDVAGMRRNDAPNASNSRKHAPRFSVRNCEDTGSWSGPPFPKRSRSKADRRRSGRNGSNAFESLPVEARGSLRVR